MRPGEKNGENYWFISKNEFETAIQKNEFLEYEINHKTAYYGTKLADVEIWLKAGHTLMKEIDTKWLEQIIQKHPELRKYFTSFFLDIPNTEISRRYFERHPDGCDTDKNNRIESAVFEREQAKKYCDYIIDATQTPEQILQEVLKIIRK